MTLCLQEKYTIMAAVLKTVHTMTAVTIALHCASKDICYTYHVMYITGTTLCLKHQHWACKGSCMYLINAVPVMTAEPNTVPARAAVPNAVPVMAAEPNTVPAGQLYIMLQTCHGSS